MKKFLVIPSLCIFMKEYIKPEVEHIDLNVVLHHCSCSAGDDNPFPCITPFIQQ